MEPLETLEINQCRTCYNATKGLKLLTDLTKCAGNQQISFSELLSDVANINIMEYFYHELPQFICLGCSRKLKAAQAFIQQTHEVNEHLLALLRVSRQKEADDNKIKCLQVLPVQVKMEYDESTAEVDSHGQWRAKVKNAPEFEDLAQENHVITSSKIKVDDENVGMDICHNFEHNTVNKSMRKLPKNIENQIIDMTKENISSRAVARKLEISQSVVIKTLKRRNTSAQKLIRGRLKLMTSEDERMKADKSITPKKNCLAITKNVSQWSARRALNAEMNSVEKLEIHQCRTCYNATKRLKLLTDLTKCSQNKQMTFADLLAGVSDINILEDFYYELPQFICACCSRKLKAAQVFIQQIHAVHKRLMAILGRQVDMNRNVNEWDMELKQEPKEFLQHELTEKRKIIEDKTKVVTENGTVLANSKLENSLAIKSENDNENYGNSDNTNDDHSNDKRKNVKT